MRVPGTSPDATLPTSTRSAASPVAGLSSQVMPRPEPQNDGSIGDAVEGALFWGLDGALWGLNELGLAGPALNAGLRLAAGEQEDAWYDAMSEHASVMLDAEYEERPTRRTYGQRVQEYLLEAKANTHLNGITESTAFHNEKFIKELEEVGDAQFVGGNHLEYLIDGPQSFAKRAEIIEGAKHSIHLLTWAIYDDPTGRDLCERLVRKAKEGVDVRVIVDRNIAARSSHLETLRYLEANGIKMIRWEDPEHMQWGNHCKMMVVDGVKAIAGGMNPGDYYSHGWHANPAYDGPKWRDTDAFTHGPASVDQEALFVRYWNSQILRQNLDLEPISMDRAALLERAGGPGESRIAVVDHLPGDNRYDVYSTMLKAVSGALKTIEIENAYFLTLPGMNELLHAALERGVRVRIFTNSNESVDEPLVSEPIMKSLPDLFRAGAEIYLKKGATLHSKFMVVDDTFATVGSLNLHPRSLYYDSEMALNIIDPKSATELREQFEAGITAEKAVTVRSLADLEVESKWYNRFIKRFFFSHL